MFEENLEQPQIRLPFKYNSLQAFKQLFIFAMLNTSFVTPILLLTKIPHTGDKASLNRCG